MKTKYDHLDKEDLIRLLAKRDDDRRYGLVWEQDEIDRDKALNEDFVALEYVEQHSVGSAPFRNLLLEGDNFDALRYLRVAYKSRVKVIYIDPPYNTGNDDFIYNDKFIDKEDSFRHSKWLEFMYRRLTLARDLLAEDGVIFVSIGEDEGANLTLLMDQVFPGMRVGTFVWRRRSGANDEKEWFLSTDHEYVLCYANKGFSFGGFAKDWSKAVDDGDQRGPWVDGPLNQGKDIRQRFDCFYPICNPAKDIWYPCDPDSVWRFATKDRATGKKIRSSFMETLIDEKRVAWPANEAIATYGTVQEILDAIHEGTAPHNLRVYERLDNYEKAVGNGQCNPKVLANIPPVDFWVGKKIGYGKPRFKRFIQDIKKDRKPVSTWILPSSIKRAELDCLDLDDIEVFQVGYTSEGTSLLNKMIGNKDFAYPKPLSLIQQLIAQATDPFGDDIVVDFFAGSATTGHAVLALNAQDDGDRSFILVSNTEATANQPSKNVCRDVTAKRLRSAIEGYSWRDAKGVHPVEGLGGEFAYMRTLRIPMESIHLDIKHDQVWYILQQLHEEGISPFVTDVSYQMMKTEGSCIIYIPRLNDDLLAEITALANATKVSTVIYSWQPGLLKQGIHSEHVLVEKIPEFLIERFGGE
ncbi:site-specific DNA-methyltransferase [uncultured Limnobacter sp.]|uniref:site-specific DNA-methyltransferase n=1 Tax=uncultured Limnobacter sp. TaxID=199681 RepID=UPI0030FC2021